MSQKLELGSMGTAIGSVILLDTPSLSKLIGVGIETLEQWRHRDRGPAFVRLGHRCVRYKLNDVKVWLEANRVTPERARQMEPTSTETT